jgi:DNA polymerase IIIc chi subunit
LLCLAQRTCEARKTKQDAKTKITTAKENTMSARETKLAVSAGTEPAAVGAERYAHGSDQLAEMIEWLDSQEENAKSSVKKYRASGNWKMVTHYEITLMAFRTARKRANRIMESNKASSHEGTKPSS